MTTTELEPTLRDLIDARLDAIERVLLRVRAAYSERRQIVDDVAAQVHELLARRSPQPTKEDVREVLASLDPPEAFVPEEYRSRLAVAPDEPVARGPQISWLALGSAGVGLFGLMLGSLCFLAEIDGGELVLLGLLVLSFPLTLCGAIAVVQVLRSEGRLTGLPFALGAALLAPMLFGNFALVTAAMMVEEIGLYLLAGAAVLQLNWYCIRQLWRWLDAWRSSLTATDRRAADVGSGWLIAAR